MRRIRTLLGVAALTLSGSAFADTIFYTLDNLGGNRWQYNYTVDNTGTNALDAFTIFFERGAYENLDVASLATDWDGFVDDPNDGLMVDGILDTYLLGFSPIAPGAALSGWSVAFDFLGAGTPGDQYFEFYDGFTFAFLSDGFTARTATTVPEPATLGLFATGLFLLFMMRRRQPAFPKRRK